MKRVAVAEHAPASVTVAEPRVLVTSGRVPALDAVRGIAIVLVMLRHAWPDVLGAGGFVGVEMFFVLSGFLITSILLADIDRGRLSYLGFYLNRALRLVPALVILAAVVSVVIVTVNPLDEGYTAGGLVTALTYTSDLPAWPLHQLTEFSHLWTLAIEEQFYLVWPVLLAGLAMRSRERLASRTGWLLGVTLAVLLASSAYEFHAGQVDVIYKWPTTWAVTLMCGCAFAVGTLRLRPSAGWAAAAVGALFGLSLLPQAKPYLWGYLVVLPVVALLALVVVANAVSDRPARLLLNPAVRYLGTISYGAYLWSYPLSVWFGPIPGLVLTVVVSSASYWLVERAFLRLKRRSTEPARRGRLAPRADSS